MFILSSFSVVVGKLWALVHFHAFRHLFGCAPLCGVSHVVCKN